jgi:hypothetical protein
MFIALLEMMCSTGNTTLICIVIRINFVCTVSIASMHKSKDNQKLLFLYRYMYALQSDLSYHKIIYRLYIVHSIDLR